VQLGLDPLAADATTTLQGRVVDATSTPVAGASAVVFDLFVGTTDATGFFSLPGIPVTLGPLTVVARAIQAGQTLEGASSSNTPVVNGVTDAGTIVISSLRFPAERLDANNFRFDVQQDLSILDGTASVYRGDFAANQGAFLVDIVAGGTPARFAGSAIRFTEVNGREIVVRQQNLAGLDVTRKVFIPLTGYFARYLEILSNPTSTPIVVDVRVLSNLRSLNGSPRIIATSSGDGLLDTSDPTNPDHWVVIDDNDDGDPFLVSTLPAIGFAFDGPTGVERAGMASFAVAASAPGQLAYQWSRVTIPPGGRVAYLHFAVQQTSRAAAQASVERLVQLPPEALTGLSPEEIAQIRNFAVPADGVSALAPLPSLNGTVTGRVLAGDGTTPVPAADVRFRSLNVLFGRTHIAASDAGGQFRFSSAFSEAGSSLAVPVDAFTLKATHPVTGVQAADAAGTFSGGQTTATRDLVFSGTGILQGLVRRHAGTPVTSGSVRVVGGTSSISTSVNVAADGRYVITGVPAGAVTLTASVPHPQGTGLTGAATASVVAGLVIAVDIPIEPTGTVRGTVRTATGSPVASLDIQLIRPAFRRVTRSDATGQFVFPDVPLGTFFVGAFEPNTNLFSGAQVTVTQDQTTTRDLTLIGFGAVQLQVNFAGGSPAPNSRLEIQEEVIRLRGFLPAGSTGADGRLTMNVPVGAFTIRAFHPTQTQSFTEVSGSIINHGDVVPVTVVLPAAGTVTGRVTFPNGAAAANVTVQAFGQDVPSRSALTDPNGSYTISGVVLPAGRSFTVRAVHPADSAVFRDATNNTLTTEGQTLAVTLTLPAVATVRVAVLKADNTPFAGVRVDIQDSLRTSFRFAGLTDASGTVSIPKVPEGGFIVRALDANTNTLFGTAAGTITPADDGQIVNVTLTAPPSGNVQGTVFAADGQTPVTFAAVQLFDAGSGQFLGSTSTTIAGFYQFAGVAAGTQGFTVRAHSPSDFTVTTQRTGAFATAGETVTLNLTLPISVIKGTVFLPDGVTVVPTSSVFVTQTDAAGDLRTFFPNRTLSRVGYTVVGVPPGDFIVTAQDPASGLAGTATGTVVDVAVPVVVNVVLQPSGVVTGTVVDAAGNAVPVAQVAVTSAEVPLTRTTQADAQGVYRFDRVALGTFTVRVLDPSTGITGSATRALAAAGETVTVNVNLPATGTVTGRIFGGDGTTPAPGAPVTVENYDQPGPSGVVFRTSSTADASGNYVAPGVPAGSVRVSGFDPTNAGLPGFAAGTLTPGATATIDVTLGTAVPFTFNLDGADGFRYDVGCRGELIDGGRADRALADAYDSAYFLRVNGPISSCLNVGRLEDDGREIVVGPAGAGGLSAVRKVFVPSAGGFARYLEVLTNPTDAPVTAAVEVRSGLGSDSFTRIVVDPSATTSTFAVTDADGICCRPVLAHVFGGPSARLSVGATQFANGNDLILYRWNVTIPAGQTVILMHFAVQRPIGDTAGAQAQAEALVNLTDSNALVGMSPAERSQVINFNVP
jgi:hypothetical protein